MKEGLAKRYSGTDPSLPNAAGTAKFDLQFLGLGPFLFTASLCDLKFNSLSELHKHWDDESLHTWCRRCNVHFYTKRERYDHVRDLKLHAICDLCNPARDYVAFEMLRKHWPYHQRDTYCSLCVIHFDSPSTLEMHMIALHRFCEACYMPFGSADDLRSHFLTSEMHSFTFCFHCECNFRDEADLNEVCSRSSFLVVSLISDG